jgi:hypothetical protein
MCTEIYARFSACPHSHFLNWTYCSISVSHVPAAGRACRRYRRRTKGSVSGRARECAECTMDRRIREQFGDAVLASVKHSFEEERCGSEGERARKRRFWHGRRDTSADEVPMFAPMPSGTDVEAWPALEMTPMMLRDEVTHKRTRHDSASVDRRESMRSGDSDGSQGRGVWGWLRSSFGGRV